MIILYFILLVLLVATIFDRDVGLVFAFAFAQNNVYCTNLSTSPLDDNKDPMTTSVTENAPDANTVGFDTSDILEGLCCVLVQLR